MYHQSFLLVINWKIDFRSTIDRNVYADPTKVVVARSPGVKAAPGTRRRPIIVDGCNVAFQHGKNDR